MTQSPRKRSKPMAMIDIVRKYWKTTMGSLLVIVLVILRIFKQIDNETLVSSIAALVAAGYLPKRKDSDE